MENRSTATEDRKPVRFGLKTLLAITAFSCLVLVPYQWFGVMYLISASVSSLLIYVCLRYYWRDQSGASLGSAFVGTFLGVMCGIGSVTFLIHGVANFCAVLLGAGLGVRPRTMAIMLVGTALAVYGFAFKQAHNEHLRIAQMLQDYPIVSLADRLSFESRNTVGQGSDESEGVSFSPAVLQNLTSREQLAKPRYGYRNVMLERLHRDTTVQFSVAAGFGFARMAYVRPRAIEIETRPPVSLGQPIELTNDYVYAATGAVGEKLQSIVKEDFLNPEMFGYIASNKTVAGFEAHGFRTFDDDVKPRRDAQSEWRLTRLELVSLLRHDPPRVYVSETLPTMDKLEGVPHRALDDFETASLPSLRFQQDLVVDEQENRITMLGALRASNDCLQCHEGKRGRLLGAFSYDLVRISESLEEQEENTANILSASR